MEHNYSEVLNAAWLSALAYGHKANVKNREAQGMFRVQGGVQQLAISGTDDLRDLIDDLDVTIVSRGYGNGLFKGVVDYTNLFLQPILAMLHKDMPIEVYGHSLGGASAVDGAKYLKEIGYTVNKVITFGAPPPGLESFAEEFKQSGIECWRFAEVWDIIPRINHLPGATQVGTGMYLKNGTVTKTDFIPMWVVRRFIEGVRKFPHHSLDLYIKDCTLLVDK